MKFPKRWKLYKKGFNDNQIAKILGVARNTICSWRKRRGLPPNAKAGGQSYKISLESTKELGYFCGLVIGDGFLWLNKNSHNYQICIESTKEKIVQVFCEIAKKLGLNPLGIYTREKTRKFPNGKIRTDINYAAIVNSKILFNALRPCKQENYHWTIPKFLTTKESLFGFLGGIFDAEGSCTSTSIMIASKHNENLIQIKNLLRELGFIYGNISVRKGRLLISGLGNIRMLIEKAEPRIKKEKVQSLLKNRPRRHTREEYQEVMRLRREISLGGMRISKITGIPVTTIEDWIYGGKKPWELKEVKK
jgi:DNA-binding transcriptional regulator YiaG